VLKIPSQYHSSLIGQSGKYAIRLEEKYSVKITFPRQSSENADGRTREQLKPDEVLVKGGRKGVAGAKSELLDVCNLFACALRTTSRRVLVRRRWNLRKSPTTRSSSPSPLALLLVFLAGVVLISMRSKQRPMLRLTSTSRSTMPVP
jgi:hypothetical protein